uniref:Mediator of RNA polymerase II transcription subunit 23 n=2 Tax=Mesocestoides corti TaxID=53468 RepID=A0A5K3FUZ1_MESCO
MVPFAGITLDTHPGFRLDRAQLTLSMIRQAKLYPPAFKTRQLSLACSLLGQLRCTQLASGLLACDERQAMGPLMTPVGLAISELIFSVMEITEAEKRTDWTIKVFGHLADLVICFVVDRIVRLDDIITKLNSKIVGRFWPVSRYFVMWFTLVCMSGFVGKNKLSDFVSCLRLYDHLFPESDELDNAAMGRLKKLEKEDTECWIRRGDLITLDTLETMAKDPDRRFIIFSPDRLFGVPDTDSAEEDQGGSSRDQTSHGTAAIDAVCDYTSSSDSSDDEDLEAGEDGPIPAKKPKLTQDEDLTHLVAAVVCAWEVVLQMNSADETTVRGQSGVGSTGGCVKDGHLPRPMPPLLYPLQLQISDWLEQLKDACGQDNSSLTESGDTAPDSQSSASVERMSWLEFIVTLNTYSPNENSQKITRSVVNAFWLPNNEHVPGIGGGLPLNNGTFTLPYGLSGAGRLKPLSHRLIRKMSVHLQMIFCNEMRQKLNEMTKPPCPEPGTACLTSPATLETFSRFLSYQVEKNLIIPILQIYKRMLQIKGQVDIPLYHDEVAGPEATELPKSMPNNDDFYAFTFWFDLLGHRLVEALPAEHRLSYRDDLFHKVELESQELVYTLDWTIVRFSRRILTPDCILYTMSKSMPNDTSPSPPALKSQHLIHPREVTSRVILLSTLQAVSAFDLLDVGSVRCIIEQQLMTVRTETRAVFGVDTARLLLPSIISRRLTDLLPSSSFGTTSFFGFCANETVLPPDGSSALAQAPIFESLEPAAGDGEPENYASLRDRLLISVYELFKSLVPEAGGEIAWDELSLQGERCFCVIITAILNGHSGLPWALINNILQLSPATVNAQLKVLCEYLIAAICKFEELDRRGLCPPAHLPTPSALLSALLTFCVQYHIITMDRLLLYLFVRSNQSPVDVAAAHSIAIFLFTQCPQLVEAINAVANFAPNSPEIISSHRWPKLLKRLHEILPEKQAINRPPADSSGSSTVLRRYPCQPVYYDHLILRLVPVLELIFTSFLDNPPPLLQLARFCNLVAPLFRLHCRFDLVFSFACVFPPPPKFLCLACAELLKYRTLYPCIHC